MMAFEMIMEIQASQKKKKKLHMTAGSPAFLNVVATHSEEFVGPLRRQGLLPQTTRFPVGLGKYTYHIRNPRRRIKPSNLHPKSYAGK